MADGEENITEEPSEVLKCRAGVMQSATAGEDKRVISLPAFSSVEDLAKIFLGVLAEATQGQHAKNGIAEMTPDPGRMQTAKGIARTGGKSIAQDKRTRAANWEDWETVRLLIGKLRFLVICMLYYLRPSTSKKDKLSLKDYVCDQLGIPRRPSNKKLIWADYVTTQLDRAVNSCQDRWDTLNRSRKPICDHESKISLTGHVSFWEMNEQQKHIVNKERRISNLEPLPQVFPREWYELMEIILIIDFDGKKITSFQIVGGNLPSSSTAHISSTITGTDDSPRGPLDAIRSQPSSSHDRDSMGPPLPLISSQAGKQRAEDEVLALPYVEHSLRSFITKRVEDECQTHIFSLWRGKEENEQKHRERLLKIEEEKLALKRKKEEEEQKHRGRLLALKEEKLQLKRQKILHPEAPASTIPRCDDTNILISSKAPANMGVAFGTIQSTFASGQQPDSTQMHDPNENAPFSPTSFLNIPQDSPC